MVRDSLTVFNKINDKIVLSLYKGDKGVYLDREDNYYFWGVTRIPSEEIELGPKTMVLWSEE